MNHTKQPRPTMHGHRFNKYQPSVPLFSDFEFWSFEFVSNFDIRISCFVAEATEMMPFPGGSTVLDFLV